MQIILYLEKKYKINIICFSWHKTKNFFEYKFQTGFVIIKKDQTWLKSLKMVMSYVVTRYSIYW